MVLRCPIILPSKGIVKEWWGNPLPVVRAVHPGRVSRFLRAKRAADGSGLPPGATPGDHSGVPRGRRTVMNLLSIILLAQLAAPAQRTVPVLSFPEPGLDDSAAYGGYRTRFFRDAAGNTVQIYLEPRGGRVVHLWADATNSSAGFSARDAGGAAVPLRWGGEDAEVAAAAGTRSLEYVLVAEAPVVHLGWFLLGSMRVERDFQYAGRHRAPFGGPPFTLPEIDRLLGALGRLEPAERRRHLALLDAPDLGALRARLRPRVTTSAGEAGWVARVVQSSLDARDSMSLELRVDPRQVIAERAGDSVTLRARSGS